MAVRLCSMVMGPVATNVYYIYDEDNKEAVVIDPAVKGQWIYDHLLGKGISVSAILITHGHFDHITGVNELREASGAKVYAPLAEKEMLADPSLNLSDENVTVKADHDVTDGEELSFSGFRLRMIETPGHTGGGCCYYCEQEKFLISGDTLFAGSIGRTDLPTGSHTTLIRSVKEKLMTLPDDVTVYPGHGTSTTIGEERKYNPYV